MGKGLREIAQGLAAVARFFRIEAQVVGVSEHPFEQELCLIQLPPIRPSEARQRFHEPKAAHVEGPLCAVQPVGSGCGVIPVH